MDDSSRLQRFVDAQGDGTYEQALAELRTCAGALAGLEGSDAVTVMGPVDAVELRSSMTLFARAAADEPVFAQVLDRFFGGEEDPATVRLL